MEKFIPRDKLSKKARRALDAERRKGWGPLSPVTRKSPNPKAYDRNKARKAVYPPDGLCFCSFPISTGYCPIDQGPYMPTRNAVRAV